MLNPGDRVLELGCGAGITALRLAGDVQSYLAADFSAEMIDTAKKKCCGSSIPGLSFQAATAEALAPEAGPFDAILSFNYRLR